MSGLVHIYLLWSQLKGGQKFIRKPLIGLNLNLGDAFGNYTAHLTDRCYNFLPVFVEYLVHFYIISGLPFHSRCQIVLYLYHITQL